MLSDIFDWLAGLSGVYPVLGVAIIVGAVFVMMAATGLGPHRHPRPRHPH